MAIGDIGMFLPRESHYQTPGAFNKMLQAEALKRAAFLSQMDQFYENLNEAQRQFDETLSFNVETRDLQLGWERERMQEELKFRREELEAETEYREGMLDLEERRVELAEDQAGLGGEGLTSFQRFKLFGLLEEELKAKTTAREEAAERGFPDTPGRAEESERRERIGLPPLPEAKVSGPVNIIGGVSAGGSAADIPGGRRGGGTEFFYGSEYAPTEDVLPSDFDPAKEYGP